MLHLDSPRYHTGRYPVKRPDHLASHAYRPIDLGTNVPYHSGLRREAAQAAFASNPFAYPDLSQLYADLSHAYEVPVNRLTVGHGATEIIERIVRLLRGYKWYIVHPTFEMVEVYCQMYGVDYELVFSPEAASPERGKSVLYYASPNGLTGQTLTPNTLRWAYVIHDNVYGEFQTPDLPQLATNEILVRSFSKSMGLAGLRCGWCVAPDEITKGLQELRSNHPINIVARDAIQSGLPSIRQVNRDWNEGKAYLESLYETVPTHAAFVLFRTPNIHTRTFGYKITPQGFYRMAVADKKTLLDVSDSSTRDDHVL